MLSNGAGADDVQHRGYPGGIASFHFGKGGGPWAEHSGLQRLLRHTSVAPVDLSASGGWHVRWGAAGANDANPGVGLYNTRWSRRDPSGAPA